MTWRETRPNEYIRYDVARSYLHNACQYIGSNGGLELKCRFDYEKTTTVPRWIPVTERLPDPDTWVLVSCDDDVTIMAVTGYGEWYFTDGDFTHGKIDAWMPLPKPWREGQE